MKKSLSRVSCECDVTLQYLVDLCRQLEIENAPSNVISGASFRVAGPEMEKIKEHIDGLDSVERDKHRQRKLVPMPPVRVAIPAPPRRSRRRRGSGRIHGVLSGQALMKLPSVKSDEFLNELLQDLTEARTRVKEDQNQFHRRTYVRTVYAYVEGVISTLAEWLSDRVEKLPIADADKLFVKSALESGSRVTTSTDSVQFVLATYARYGCCETRFFASPGWMNFQDARQIRNIVTHPTRIRGVTISDADFRLVQSAEKWFCEVVDAIDKSCVENEGS